MRVGPHTNSGGYLWKSDRGSEINSPLRRLRRRYRLRSSTPGTEGETQVPDNRPTINPSPAATGLSRLASRMAFQCALLEVPTTTPRIHHPPATATTDCTRSKIFGMRLVSQG